MSSEQVIAKLDAVAGEGCKVSLETHTNAPDRLSTPANLVTVPASELRAMREEIEHLQARNAEQAARIASQAETIALMFKAGVAAEQDGLDAESKLSALLDGIEGLEKRWRATDGDGFDGPEYDSGVIETLANCADDLKALREKANGSQGERGDA